MNSNNLIYLPKIWVRKDFKFTQGQLKKPRLCTTTLNDFPIKRIQYLVNEVKRKTIPAVLQDLMISMSYEILALKKYNNNKAIRYKYIKGNYIVTLTNSLVRDNLYRFKFYNIKNKTTTIYIVNMVVYLPTTLTPIHASYDNQYQKC